MHIFATTRLFARVSGPDLPACENVDLLIYAGEAPALFIPVCDCAKKQDGFLYCSYREMRL